ncbi:gluconokinase [Cryobacterium tepidiphilum]|uniref:Gluconokinase n=1 Tax=Cryobacterium tepidiphilum TaxID=2486026 RepID=A0A3M8LP43_9MICO|nr:gluconokinase [Cryobacterium tepidiphilum]RNE67253.1 gluconokinase [Cryobacterium tepidiphilum]
MSNGTQSEPEQPLVLVVMGVSGSGKTTVAKILAKRLGWAYEEGDSLHPRANVEKMASGHPLDDADRAPWLELIADWIDGCLDRGKSGVVTCSALKRAYRDVLDRRGSGVVFVYLEGSKELIADRLSSREGHFMPPGLLDSQFADLQVPGDDEPAVHVNITPLPPVIAQNAIDKLGLNDVAAARTQ